MGLAKVSRQTALSYADASLSAEKGVDMRIIGMNRVQLLNLSPRDLTENNRQGGSVRLLTGKELFYIAETLGAFWTYDYEALKRGKPGLHAELRSGLHSDGFLVARIMLNRLNIKLIVATQIALKFEQLGMPKPNLIAGVPYGACDFAQKVSWLLGAEYVGMKKVDGKVTLVNSIDSGKTLLLIDDLCTRGSGFKEAAKEIISKQPAVEIMPVAIAMVNRSGLRKIFIDGIEPLEVVALVERRINDWQSKNCPLCNAKSRAIKPKETDENWHSLVTSQQ